MIKNGLKSFLSNLKYIFTPLGVLALGAVLGLSILLPACSAAARGLVSDIKTIASSVSIDFPALKDAIVAAVRALDWSDPLAALRTMLRKAWIVETLDGCVHSLLRGSETVSEQITAAVERAARRVAAGVAALIVCLVLALIGGYMLTRFLVRRNMAKRGVGKFFLATLVDAVLSAAFVVLLVLLQAAWSPAAVVFVIVAVLLNGLLALAEAYFLHGRGKIPLKSVINGRNVACLYAVGAIICAIAVVFFLLVWQIANAAVAIFLAIPLIEITFTVLNLNAESYVLHEVEKHKGDAGDDRDNATQSVDICV